MRLLRECEAFLEILAGRVAAGDGYRDGNREQEEKDSGFHGHGKAARAGARLHELLCTAAALNET